MFTNKHAILFYINRAQKFNSENEIICFLSILIGNFLPKKILVPPAKKDFRETNELSYLEDRESVHALKAPDSIYVSTLPRWDGMVSNIPSPNQRTLHHAQKVQNTWKNQCKINFHPFYLAEILSINSRF